MSFSACEKQESIPKQPDFYVAPGEWYQQLTVDEILDFKLNYTNVVARPIDNREPVDSMLAGQAVHHIEAVTNLDHAGPEITGADTHIRRFSLSVPTQSSWSAAQISTLYSSVMAEAVLAANGDSARLVGSINLTGPFSEESGTYITGSIQTFDSSSELVEVELSSDRIFWKSLVDEVPASYEIACYRTDAHLEATESFSARAIAAINQRKCNPDDYVFTYNIVETVTNPDAILTLSAAFAYRIDAYPTGASSTYVNGVDRYLTQGPFATYYGDATYCMSPPAARNYGYDTHSMGIDQAYDIFGINKNGAVTPEQARLLPLPTFVTYDPIIGPGFDPLFTRYWETTMMVGEVGIHVPINGQSCP